MKKIIGMAGGALVIMSVFLPMVKIMDVTVAMFSSTKGVAIFFIICGLVAIGAALLAERWLSVISILLSLIVILLSLKYQGDVTSREGALVGVGLWIMLAGGVLSLAGAVVGLFKKKESTSAA
jgi:uncharacterized membrane protein